MHKPGGASLDANTSPAPTEGTASVKLIGVAEKAATAEPEVLEPRAESAEQSGLEMLLLPQKGLGKPGLLPQEAPTVGTCRHDQPLREGTSKGECRPKLVPQETLQAGILAPQKSVLTILKGMTPGFPEKEPFGTLNGSLEGRKFLT